MDRVPAGVHRQDSAKEDGMIFDLESTLLVRQWNRDPDADCDVFTAAESRRDCHGDGHYLCAEMCGRYLPEEL